MGGLPLRQYLDLQLAQAALRPRFLWGVAPKAPVSGRSIFPQKPSQTPFISKPPDFSGLVWRRVFSGFGKTSTYLNERELVVRCGLGGGKVTFPFMENKAKVCLENRVFLSQSRYAGGYCMWLSHENRNSVTHGQARTAFPCNAFLYHRAL